MKTKTYVIDTDQQPSIPYSGWTIESHKGMGKIEWNPKNFSLYLSENQAEGKYINGEDLQKELSKKAPVNACVMEFLEKNPQLFPEEWKTDATGDRNYIYAWGTIFRNSGGSLYVRCWYWDDGALQSRCHWLGGDWGVRDPALVVASSAKVSVTKTEYSDPKTLDLSELKAQNATLLEENEYLREQLDSAEEIISEIKALVK